MQIKKPLRYFSESHAVYQEVELHFLKEKIELPPEWEALVAIACFPSQVVEQKFCHGYESEQDSTGAWVIKRDTKTGHPVKAYRKETPFSKELLAFKTWLNRDPIGEAGGLNLYGYVGNNPVNYIDPLGLLVVITTTQGTVISVWTAQQFINQVQAQPNGTISDINFVGHANSMVQGIGDDNTPTEGLWLQNGVPVLNGASTGNNNVSAGDVLNNKMTPNGHINLDGCHAAGPNMQDPSQPNLPQALSQAVPGVDVTGSTWTTLMNNPPDENGNTHMPFTVNTYFTSPTVSVNVSPSFITQQNNPTVFMPR